jgi:D-alanine-D-alanine ligase
MPEISLNVAVLLGGISAEREISVQSGTAVADALTQRGHRVTPIDPQDTEPAAVNWKPFDVVFLALHGTFGEDGEMQRILEAACVPFTGSSSTASRLAFSKSAAKERFAQHGVPTPPAVLVHQADSETRIRERLLGMGFPLVVKPDAQGSSLGVTIVRGPDEFSAALMRCFEYCSFGLIEPYVAGPEWTVALIDDEVLPPICIRPQSSFFDFDAKYRDDATGYDFDGGVEPDVRAMIGRIARSACRALGTRGATRVDLILDDRGQPWVLEVNTIPGLTSHSLLPKAAARAGYSFGELCELLCRRAMTAAKRRAA